ncbi:MAG: DUF4350 domain-containing protein [Novosphingobium sp.]
MFTTLPILWPERGDFRGLIGSDAPPHWALAILRRHGNLRPLDSLAKADGGATMASGSLLVMAQPRPLSPQENVTLDRWVRGGGHVLLFADPMLTADSIFALGDKRRPQDVVLLSPILTHWGLELHFDEDQPAGEQLADWDRAKLPVNLPGRFALFHDSRNCRLIADGLGARCTVGKGRVLALADAALLEDRGADAAANNAGLFEQILNAASTQN